MANKGSNPQQAAHKTVAASQVRNTNGGKNPHRSNPFVKLVPWLLGIVLGLAIGFIVFRSYPESTHVHKKDVRIDSSVTVNSAYPYINPLVSRERFRKVSIFKVEMLEAKVREYISQNVHTQGAEVAVYFRDLTSNRWFGINEKSRFSPSSLMKVPIMITVLKKAEEEPGLLSEKVEFRESRDNKEKGMDASTRTVGTNMSVGQQYTVKDLLYNMIARSDNEATILLLDFITQAEVERVEAELGYLIPGDAIFFEDIISVRQYSAFFRVLYNASYLNQEYSNYALDLLSQAQYGYGIRKTVPANIKVSHKFGRNAVPLNDHELKVNQLHHFGIVYLPDQPYLIGIMTREADERRMEKYISDIAALVYKEMSSTKVDAGKELLRDIE